MITRRSLIGGILAAFSAPAFVREVMPIYVPSNDIRVPTDKWYGGYEILEVSQEDVILLSECERVVTLPSIDNLQEIVTKTLLSRRVEIEKAIVARNSLLRMMAR
jgi:hypothetical protein